MLGQKAGSGPAVPPASLGHQWPKPLGILSSVPSISLIPRVFSYFQDLPSSVFSLWDHLLTETFGFWDKLFSPELQALGFPNLSGPCGEAWCDQPPTWWLSHGSLLTGVFRLCCFTLAHVLSKFASRPSQQVASFCFRVQKFDFG